MERPNQQAAKFDGTASQSPLPKVESPVVAIKRIMDAYPETMGRWSDAAVAEMDRIAREERYGVNYGG